MILHNANQIISELEKITTSSTKKDKDQFHVVSSARNMFNHLQQTFDKTNGGFNGTIYIRSYFLGAPKFPTVPLLRFLLDVYITFKSNRTSFKNTQNLRKLCYFIDPQKALIALDTRDLDSIWSRRETIVNSCMEMLYITCKVSLSLIDF